VVAGGSVTGIEDSTAGSSAADLVGEVDLTPVSPAYGRASLADVTPSVLASLGVPGCPDSLELATGPLAGVTSVGVLLVDGLGYHALARAAESSPVLADALAGRLAGASLRPITSGFPSTTPTSVVSLTTGATPGAHGVLGIVLNVPGTDRTVDALDWGADPDPLLWQPVAPLFGRAVSAGVAARVVARPEFRGSGLTEAAYRGGEFVDSTDVETVAAGMLAGMARRPSVVFGYLPDVDGAGHRHGNYSAKWSAAVSRVDRLLTLLIDGLTPGSALVVTADHGQLDIPTEQRRDIDADPRLTDGLRLVAGEARVRYLHTRPGATADVLAAWTGVLGPAARVLTRDEAIAQGWFGPVPESHLQRIGDIVAICREDHILLASAHDKPSVASMVGFHGSCTAVEMTVPLLVIPAG
jgi:hypothetical protein